MEVPGTKGFRHQPRHWDRCARKSEASTWCRIRGLPSPIGTFRSYAEFASATMHLGHAHDRSRRADVRYAIPADLRFCDIHGTYSRHRHPVVMSARPGKTAFDPITPRGN